jgi:hypothetical protein
MTQEQSRPRSVKTEILVWGVIVGAVIGFLGWGWFYLFVLRPQMNLWLSHYISGYPAMLHVFPIVGVPILVGAAIGQLARLLRKRSAPDRG